MKIFTASLSAALALFLSVSLWPGSLRASEPGIASQGSGISADSHSGPFSVDPRLRKNVDFWIRIYTQYDTSHGVIHDAKYIDHIYQVLNVRSSPHAVLNAKMHWRRVLLSLHHKSKAMALGKHVNLTPDELKVFAMFSDVHEPDKFLAAAHRKRLRFQLGQKNRFIQGLRYSGRYLHLMEEIFRREGLPIELTRLPFVESSFNIKARSKVGASGIWQFMRSTGRLFLTVNDAVDERNDPIRSTEAAAKLLKINYESLKNWGLAVTAYNHGRKGMMRAVRKVGSDRIEDVIDDYRARDFGFAGSNYYACLLAAIEVEKNADKYFGKIQRDPPLQFYEVRIPDFINLRTMVKLMKLDLKKIEALNPGLSDDVFRGRLYVPAGYLLRLPRPEVGKKMADGAERRIFLAGYSAIPGVYKFQHQRFRH